MSLTKPYVTKQEIEQARQLDLLSYLQQHEPEELVRFSSNVYTLRSHDSLKISNGKWYQWSTGIGGISALDYLIKVQGMDFVSAVSKILSYSPLAEPARPTPAKRQKPVFTLPAPYENNDRVRTYLTGRGLSMDLLRMCIDAGLIYEDMRHNCVFVGFDRKKVPRYAMLRSSSPYSTFLGEVSGSDKRYSFSLSGSGETLYVFESAIDCLSFIELQRMKTDELKPDNYLSLSGVYRPGEGKRTELPAALQEYHVFKLAAGKTAKSILISLGVRLEKFNLPQIAAVVCHDELNIPALGEHKTALLAVIPDNDSSLNFIIGMMYSSIFQELYYVADQVYGGRLPVHVHCVMDEFANVALPDEFDKLLATMRSREISVSIIIQNIAQLKALFEKQWESIIGNCDEFLYLGGNETSTHKMISESYLGRATIDTNTYGKSTGRNGSYSTNYQLSGRELYTADEVRMLDNRYALLFIRGEHPIQDEKYDILRHPNISFTADGGMPPYMHGQAPLAFDPDEVLLSGEYGDYEALSEEEIFKLYNNETEEKKDD